MKKNNSKAKRNNINTTPASEMPITDLISFPVRFESTYRTIYDAKNREIARVKTLQTSDERLLRIGDFIADAINAAEPKVFAAKGRK